MINIWSVLTQILKNHVTEYLWTEHGTYGFYVVSCLKHPDTEEVTNHTYVYCSPSRAALYCQWWPLSHNEIRRLSVSDLTA